ncbi:hypothetical protein AB0B89_15440 [Sphaerisporangium sp. NPDC049002]|uniref:hypothetical protein n=1 Tax=unclassified Sphaerisporangium TaxID=2630420 RepID=UPI0033DD112C
MPVLLLSLIFMGPVWIHDHHLNAIADEFLSHPLPPETEFADDEVQSSVALRGNSNHCDYRLRFNLSTKLSVNEIVEHYKAAFGPVVVWTPSKNPPFPLTFDGQHLIVVEIQEPYQDPGWDLRCY